MPAGDMVGVFVLWPSPEPCALRVPGMAEGDAEEPRVRDVPGGLWGGEGSSQ